MNALKKKLVVLCFILSFAQSAFAGFDVSGTVTAIQVAPDGTIHFAISAGPASTYCASGWAGLNMLVPAGDPNYSYYYGLLMLAISKSKTLYIPNISVFNGTTPCDITKTGPD